jgi:hypothetical protein
MKSVNNEPIFADFGNSDPDGAVRLITDGTLDDLKRLNISLSEGMHLWLTDYDVEVTGNTTYRNGVWVLIPDSKFKQVPLDAPYHINNQQQK